MYAYSGDDTPTCDTARNMKTRIITPEIGFNAEKAKNTIGCAQLDSTCHPSHAAGKRSLVPALARAEVAVGADGLIVEMHPQPEKAVSDGAQSLDPKQFAKMMADLKPYIALWKQARMAETAAAV